MKQNRHINRVAVIGSGIMGSRIACHFANIGVEVLLLDILPFDLTEEQKQIFGFTSIVPVDERVRIYTLRPWKEQMDDIQFRSEPYPI